MQPKCKLSDTLTEELKKALRPAKCPRGYFDQVYPLVREMMDNGWKLHQTANALISRRVFPSRLRKNFLDAMRGRISRLRRPAIAAAIAAASDKFQWRQSLLYDSIHILPDGSHIAICGVSTETWAAPISESSKCARCLGISRRSGLIVTI